MERENRGSFNLVVELTDPPRGARVFTGVEPIEDLVDPLGVGAEDGHELSRWHLLPLPAEECLEPQQVRRVPGREHRQRAEQAQWGEVSACPMTQILAMDYLVAGVQGKAGQ